MSGEVGLVEEGFPAVFTSIRLLSCVSSLMESQKPLAAEGFLTLFTLIGPLPGMNSLVLNEMALVDVSYTNLTLPTILRV